MDRVDLPFGYTLHAFHTLASTIQEAERLALAGAAHGTLVTTLQQTKGQGRGGKPWVSLPGNIHMSMVLKDKLDHINVSACSFLAAVVIGEVLRPVLPKNLAMHYKWPNDVLLGGKKVSGVLLHVEPNKTPGAPPLWIILSLGLNLVASPRHLEQPATSLKEAGIVFSESEFIARFCETFYALYNILHTEGFPPIKELWCRHAWALGQEVSLQQGGHTHRYVFEGISDHGHIMLTACATGEHFAFATGELFTPSNAQSMEKNQACT